MGDLVFYVARSSEFINGRPKYLTLAGNSSVKYCKIPVLKKWVNGRYVALFHKATGEIVCPHFWEFKPFIGCPFMCSYCYLQGTFFGNKKPRNKGIDKAVEDLRKFLRWASSIGLITVLNTGELADSLAVKEWTKELLEKAIPVLEDIYDEYGIKHKLLLLSKAGTKYIDPLLEDPKRYREYVIVSFSINAETVAEEFEKGASPPSDRIEATKQLQKVGYVVRIRIDPMMPDEGWQLYYTALINELLSKVTPERITLGTLRGLSKTIRFTKDRGWLRFFESSERTAWGLKIEKKLRVAMYAHAIRELRRRGYKGPIALCKETLDVWEELVNMRLIDSPGTRGVWENVICNCKL